jgi:hypothetical protein
VNKQPASLSLGAVVSAPPRNENKEQKQPIIKDNKKKKKAK